MSQRRIMIRTGVTPTVSSGLYILDTLDKNQAASGSPILEICEELRQFDDTKNSGRMTYYSGNPSCIGSVGE